MTFLEPGGWVLVYAAAAGLLLAWILRLELPRRRRRWRLAALTAVAACLFLLAARPTRMTRGVERSAILITPRAVEGEVASLQADGGVFALYGAAARDAVAATDAALLARDRPGVTHWQVAGVGLQPWDLEALPGRISFAAPAPPGVGIDRAAWPHQLSLGEELVVAGSAVTGGQGATLDLVGPAGVEQTADLAPDAASFELRVRPRREGRQIYRLVLSVDGVPVAGEEVDTTVGPPHPPTVLWLEGAPSFETRHVKSWLRDLGGAMVVRSRVSRDRYRFEFVNHERIEVTRLTPGLLEGFDAVIVDDPGWRGLSGGERRTIAEAVAQGLGLLMASLGRETPGEPLFAGFEAVELADLDDREVRAAGPGLSPLAPLVIPGRHVVRGTGQRTWLRDAAGRSLGVLQPHGLGTVAVGVMEDTYRWALRGEAAVHRRYWSHALSAISRPHSATVDFRLPGGPIVVDEPVELSLLATAAWSVTLTEPDGGELSLPTAQDVVEARLWHATSRPRRVGWHRLAAGGAEAWFYAHGRSSWRALRERRAHSVTARRAALGSGAWGVGGAGAGTGATGIGATGIGATGIGANGVAELPAGAQRGFELVRPWPSGWFLALLAAALAALWADDQWSRAGARR